MAEKVRVLAIRIEDVIIQYDDTCAEENLDEKGLPKKIAYAGFSSSRWQAFFQLLQAPREETDEKTGEKISVKTHIVLFSHTDPKDRSFEQTIAQHVSKLVAKDSSTMYFEPTASQETIYKEIAKKYNVIPDNIFVLNEHGLRTPSPNALLKKHSKAQYTFPKRAKSHQSSRGEEHYTFLAMKNVLAIFGALPKEDSEAYKIISAKIAPLVELLSRFDQAIKTLEKQQENLGKLNIQDAKATAKFNILRPAIAEYKSLLNEYYANADSEEKPPLKIDQQTPPPGNAHDFYQQFLRITQKNFTGQARKTLGEERGWANTIGNFMINAVFLVGTGIIIGAAVLATYGLFRPLKAKSLYNIEMLENSMKKSADDHDLLLTLCV